MCRDVSRPLLFRPPDFFLGSIKLRVGRHFEHADSISGGGVLEAGGVQHMTHGLGAEHSGRNHSQTKEMQFLQLWILPDRRGPKPEVIQRQHSMCRRTTSKISLAPQNLGKGSGGGRNDVEAADRRSQKLINGDAERPVEACFEAVHGPPARKERLPIRGAARGVYPLRDPAAHRDIVGSIVGRGCLDEVQARPGQPF